MKPLISYYGGKQRIASKIVPLLPPHTVYVEPFAGGLSVLYAKGKPSVSNKDHYREVINDTLGQLITLYRVAKLQPELLLSRINATLHSRRDYYRAVSIYKEPEGHDDLTVAWATYIGFMQSFAHSVGGGWKTGRKSENHAATFIHKADNALMQVERIRECHIENRDAIDLIKAWDSPQTLFYCDPPYPGTTQGHYGGYSHDDFKNLIDALEAAQGSVVLSCYPNDTVPKEWLRHDFSAVMSASNGRSRKGHDTKRTECVWVVDRSDSMPDKLKRVATEYRPKTSKTEQVLFNSEVVGNETTH